VLARREIILKGTGFDADLFIAQGYPARDFFLRLRELSLPGPGYSPATPGPYNIGVLFLETTGKPTLQYMSGKATAMINMS
jgi:hypothetical protein